eukprot:562393-Pelagomonas_calceolata.AAC.1
MGGLKGRPYPMPCLGETTEGTYLLKRFKQGNASDTFFDTCTHQAVSASDAVLKLFALLVENEILTLLNSAQGFQLTFTQ